MDNTINFKGAFWLNQPSAAVKKDLLSTIEKKRKQIFNNFTQEGDILCITRKGTDKLVAECLSRHRIKFKYYPGLSTKSGFDDEKPEEAIKILSEYKDKIVTKVAELKEMFKIRHFNLNLSQNKKENTIEKSLQALKLNPQEYVIKKRNGFNEIYTKDKELVASISEPGQYGFRYARVEPKIAGDEVKRYAIRDGEIKFTYMNNPDDKVVNGTTTFLKNYIKAVNANKVTHNAVHR